VFIIASYLCGCGHHLHFSRTHCVSGLQNIPFTRQLLPVQFPWLVMFFFPLCIVMRILRVPHAFPTYVFLLHGLCVSYAFILRLFCMSYAFLCTSPCVSYAFLMRFPCASYAFLIYLLCICIYMHVLCISYTVLLRFRMHFETNTCCFAQNVCMCALRCMHACIVQSA
jgi:hypothetical protein